MPTSAATNALRMMRNKFMRLASPELSKMINKCTSTTKNLYSAFVGKTTTSQTSLPTSTYDRIIPEVFGVMRFSGNNIWCSDITTTVKKTPSFLIFNSHTTTTIRMSFAVALCFGPVDTVSAIYADDTLLDLSTLQVAIYLGNETQMPDPTMQSYLGDDMTPACRGLCYVVFTDFPMEQYGGQVPTLTFDVKRVLSLASDDNMVAPEKLISGVIVIPATGEFVYDTTVQYKYYEEYVNGQYIRTTTDTQVNQNNNTSGTDFSLSMDNLQQTITNLEWTSLVVSWFGDNTDGGLINIYPAIEFVNYVDEPSKWNVAGIDRDHAKTITLDDDGRPIYGGTVSDCAVVRALQDLKSRGLKVCFYPMLLMDLSWKPWRGYITTDIDSVDHFFNSSNGYNKFILHYANLVAGLVDAFIIGSEFVSMTKITDGNGNFPSVDEFVSLTGQVRAILGNDVKLTYAADWTEYHHTDGGWYNLDKLWACDDIDVISIDAYFPLSNSPESVYDIPTIETGWHSAEGYDFYYTDGAKTQTAPLDPPYAWKNVEWFWSNQHWNPNGTLSPWVPKSKKVWFTEYGFPSVDCCTNEPNVFYSPGTQGSGFPILSSGNVDFKAQRCALYASESYWAGSEFVEQKFVWCWDARPYPFFPALTDVWSDCECWQYGHWMNGKLGNSSLGNIVYFLCKQCGLDDDEIDVTELDQDIPGYIINQKQSAIQYIILLAQLFQFDGYIKDGVLTFKQMKNLVVHELSLGDFIADSSGVKFTETRDTDFVGSTESIELVSQDIDNNYKPTTVYARDISRVDNGIVSTYQANVALDYQDSISVCNRVLLALRANASAYTFSLSSAYSDIDIMDVVCFMDENGLQKTIRIQSKTIVNQSVLEFTGVSDDLDMYGMPMYNESVAVGCPPLVSPIAQTKLYTLDIYNFDLNSAQDTNPFFYVVPYTQGDNWNGCDIYISVDDESNYAYCGTLDSLATVGSVTQLPSQTLNMNYFDKVSSVGVVLLQANNGAIASATQDDWIDDNNLALVGNEIVCFKDVWSQDDNNVYISSLTRGRFSTNGNCWSHCAGERFIMLDVDKFLKLSIQKQYIGRKIYVKAVSHGLTMDSAESINFVFNGLSTCSFLPSNKRYTHQSNGDIIIEWLSKVDYETDFFDDDGKVYQYYIRIFDASYNIKRQMLVSQVDSFNYTSNMQMADFGTLVGNNLSFDVAPAQNQS